MLTSKVLSARFWMSIGVVFTVCFCFCHAQVTGASFILVGEAAAPFWVIVYAIVDSYYKRTDRATTTDKEDNKNGTTTD